MILRIECVPSRIFGHVSLALRSPKPLKLETLLTAREPCARSLLPGLNVKALRVIVCSLCLVFSLSIVDHTQGSLALDMLSAAVPNSPHTRDAWHFLSFGIDECSRSSQRLSTQSKQYEVCGLHLGLLLQDCLLLVHLDITGKGRLHTPPLTLCVRSLDEIDGEAIDTVPLIDCRTNHLMRTNGRRTVTGCSLGVSYPSP